MKKYNNNCVSKQLDFIFVYKETHPLLPSIFKVQNSFVSSMFGMRFIFQGKKENKTFFFHILQLCFNPIRTEGVSRKHTSYIIDSHVKMSEVNGFFFLDFAN